MVGMAKPNALAMYVVSCSKHLESNMLLNEDCLESLTTRSMQALGGIVLYRYFKSRNKLTAEIQVLALHQISVLVEEDLLKWERSGAALSINGRGDPNPEYFAIIDMQLEKVPSKIIDASTEIGLCALYTDDHAESLLFLGSLLKWTCFEEIPMEDEILEALPRGRGWGAKISKEKYKNIIVKL